VLQFIVSLKLHVVVVVADSCTLFTRNSSNCKNCTETLCPKTRNCCHGTFMCPALSRWCTCCLHLKSFSLEHFILRSAEEGGCAFSFISLFVCRLDNSKIQAFW